MTDQVTDAGQTGDNQAAQQTAQPSFAVPQEYQGAGWTEKVKSVDDLWKLTANSQSLLGKRPAGIPANDAPQEEWDKYYTAAGRPESADKYELSKIDGLPEGFDIAPYEGKLKEIAHKAGMSARQADIAWKEFIALELGAYGETSKSQAERQEQMGKQFNELSSKLFGDQYEPLSKQTQEYIAKSLPPELKVDWDSMPNETMAAFIQLTKYTQNEIDAVKKQYGGEDKLAGSGGQSASMSIEEVRAELVKANSELSKAKVFSPEYKQIEENRNKLRETLSRMVNK